MCWVDIFLLKACKIQCAQKGLMPFECAVNDAPPLQSYTFWRYPFCVCLLCLFSQHDFVCITTASNARNEKLVGNRANRLRFVQSEKPTAAAAVRSLPAVSHQLLGIEGCCGFHDPTGKCENLP